MMDKKQMSKKDKESIEKIVGLISVLLGILIFIFLLVSSDILPGFLPEFVHYMNLLITPFFLGIIILITSFFLGILIYSWISGDLK